MARRGQQQDDQEQASDATQELNLPNHRDPFTKHFIDRVKREVAYKNGDTDDPIHLHKTCPVEGCGYPLVSRIRAPGEVNFQIMPENWTGRFFRVCLWDPDHDCVEFDPLAPKSTEE